jgi:hypothetical protein
MARKSNSESLINPIEATSSAIQVETPLIKRTRTIPNNCVIYCDYTEGNSCNVVVTVRKKVIAAYHYKIDANLLMLLASSEPMTNIWYKMVFARNSSFEPIITISLGDRIKAAVIKPETIMELIVGSVAGYILGMFEAEQTEEIISEENEDEYEARENTNNRAS